MILAMSDFQIIDPHIHYWDPHTTPRSVSKAVKLLGRFPILLDRLIRLAMPNATVNYFGSTTLFTEPFTPDVYFSEAGRYRDRIKGVVHIQADWQAKKPTDFAQETAWLDRLNRPPLAVIGEARLDKLDHLDAVLNAHEAASNRFRGIRDMLAHHQSKSIHNFNETEKLMQSENFRSGFARLGERGLSYDAFIYSPQLPDLCDVVEAIPTTSIVVDHMATPVGLMGAFGEVGTTSSLREQIKIEWMNGLQRLAQSDHVHIKLSGMFMHVLGWDYHNWPEGRLSADDVVEKIGPYVQFMLDTFGVDRCMFASNFPPDRVLMQFDTYYDACFKMVEHLSLADQKKLFHDNAARFYRIES
ncbi:MAG: L-fuconolactonase [Cellvibrionaceae bacterium]|jgi:L-fuconolactonase